MTARIIGYKEHVLQKLGLTAQPSLVHTAVRTLQDEDEEIDDKLASTVDLILVDDVKIASGDGSLFNHPKNKVRFYFSVLLFMNCIVALFSS